MTAPHEIIPAPVPWSSLPNAAGWLLGYVRTDVPGHREYVLGGAGGDLYVVAPDEYRFDELITEIGHDFAWSANGRVVSGGNDETYPDRLGWLIGLTSDAGVTPAHTDAEAVIPPAGIPLMAVTWTRVDNDADRQRLLDLYRRNQGYAWGAATLWRCLVKMHRYAFDALKTGWCLRGKVTLGAADKLNDPVSASDVQGAITGYVLGPSPESLRWVDPTQQTIELEIILVTQ